MKVPNNKKVYVGGQRFIEGDVLPPYVVQRHDFDLKTEEEKIIEKYDKKSSKKKSKSAQREFNY